MIPLSPLLVALLCLPTCGCGVVATQVITQPISQSLRNESRESEARERCEKKHPGVPDECPKGDMECEARVDDFNKCVDREVKKLPEEGEAIERCEKKYPGVPDECPKGDEPAPIAWTVFLRCFRFFAIH
jgi:hypothetical protein